MDKDQALNIIKQACASIQADLRTHEQIQSAIKAVEEALGKPKTKTPE